MPQQENEKGESLWREGNTSKKSLLKLNRVSLILCGGGGGGDK